MVCRGMGGSKAGCNKSRLPLSCILLCTFFFFRFVGFILDYFFLGFGFRFGFGFRLLKVAAIFFSHTIQHMYLIFWFYIHSSLHDPHKIMPFLVFLSDMYIPMT